MEVFLDLETQNIPYMGHKSTPFNPENYIVAAGWALGDAAVQYRYFGTPEEANASQWLSEALAGASVLVAHNATFELHWLLHRHKQELLSFLKRGGRVFCTAYAEYLLSAQTETYPALEDCSLKYGGTAKIDQVKLLWEQGINTASIEPTLLLDYLVNGDVPNTRLVYHAQIQKLEEAGMLDAAWLRMESLLFNAVSTFHGLYVDVDVANKNHTAQLEEAAEIQSFLESYLPKDLPEEFEFNWGSDYHLSALLFGGPIKYDVKVPYDPPKFEKADFYLFTDFETGKQKYIPVEQCTADKWVELQTLYGDADVYSRGKNKGTPKVHSLETDVPKLKWGEDIYEFDGLIRFSDLPIHVSEQYLSKRAEFKGKRFLTDGVTPVYSTSGDSLDLLAKFTDVAKPIANLAKLDKDNGTYYRKEEYYADGRLKKVKGMLQYVGPDGIVHHVLNNTSTITGRLSSSNPNLQNLPRDGTSKVKEMFASRFENGYVVEVDYTALEVVLLAAASGDVALMKCLTDGIDMHCYRLAGVLNEPYKDVLEKCHNAEHPEHKKYKQMRTDIKPQSFAFQYGASAEGISYATGCTVEAARKFIDAETKLFPRSVEYRQVIRDEVERTGALPENMQREMLEDGRWIMYRRGYFQAPTGTKYCFRQIPQWQDGQNVMDYKDTQLANYWCQGEASFIVQVACGLVVRWLIENDFFGGNVLCINTVHDAIYLDCSSEEWAKYAGAAVKQIMEATPAMMQEAIPALADWQYNTTPFPAVAEYGKNMMNKQHI